jgi:hypothetical protein
MLFEEQQLDLLKKAHKASSIYNERKGALEILKAERLQQYQKGMVEAHSQQVWASMAKD